MKLLIVEDDEDIQSLYKEQLGGDYEIIAARTMGEAFELFGRHWRKLDAIVMDGLLNGLSTVTLTRHIRARFDKPVIANSNSDYHKKKLVEAGCQHWSPSKDKLENVVRGLRSLI